MPEIVTAGVRIKDPESLFGKYQVSNEDLKRYRRMIEAGDGEQAISDFVSEYMTGYVELYNATMINYMQKAQEGQLDDRDLGALLAAVPALSLALAELQNDNFRAFVEESMGPAVFAENGIRSKAVQNAILEETLSRFEQQTFGAMAETQNNVLAQIRQMQRAMIIENQRLKDQGIIGAAIRREIKAFREGLLKKFPEYYNALESGNILKSRKFGPAGERVITYNLADYSAMATRTTLLNVDRTAVEVAQTLSGADLVEFYNRDTRPVKEPREICQDILSKKIGGKSYLAMKPEAAALLGVMTVEDARAKGAFGPNCRHSIRQSSVGAESLSKAPPAPKKKPEPQKPLPPPSSKPVESPFTGTLREEVVVGGNVLTDGPEFAARRAEVLRGVFGDRQVRDEVLHSMIAGGQGDDVLLKMRFEGGGEPEIVFKARAGSRYQFDGEITKGLVHVDFMASRGKAASSVLSMGSLIENASELGLRKVRTFAGKGRTTVGGVDVEMNGWKMWPKLGFNGRNIYYKKDLARSLMDRGLSAEQAEAVMSAPTVQDIIALKGGSKLWEKVGHQFEAEFDLDPDSGSVKLFKKVYERVRRRGDA